MHFYFHPGCCVCVACVLCVGQVQRLHADVAAELAQWHGTAAQLEAQLHQQGTQLAEALHQAQQVGHGDCRCSAGCSAGQQPGRAVVAVQKVQQVR